LYLFDEPLSNLDAQLRDEMRSEIKRLHQELGKTFIYVTHDQIEAMTLADRIVLLRDGQIEQAGAPLDMFERPATQYVAGFLGSPPMNFVPATLVAHGAGYGVRLEDGAELALPPARVAQLAARVGQAVTLGLRPEHLSRADGELRSGLARYAATVDLVQPTGSRTYATFKLGGTEAIAELEAHDVQRANERIELALDMNRAVFIDPGTQRVL
jgi:multiple sugar transport system ATP-binding protein